MVPGSLPWFNKYEKNPDMTSIFYTSAESESYAIIIKLMIIYFILWEPVAFSKYMNYKCVLKDRIPKDVAVKVFQSKTVDYMAMVIYKQLEPIKKN
jgi:hypothetical protein